MALWDLQISDLRSIGVQFSQIELESLRSPSDGMQAVHLHPVVDPSSPDGYVWYMTGPGGGYLYVAEVLTLMHPNAVVLEGFPDKRAIPLIESVDNTWDILSGPVPYYLAILDTEEDDMMGNEGWVRTEEVHPYPFWACLPLQGADEVAAAHRLASISYRRLSDSLYDDILQICQFEEHNEFMLSAVDVWQVCNGYATLGEDIPQSVWDEIFDEWSEPTEGPKWVTQAFQRLIDANYVDNPQWNKVRMRMNVNSPFGLKPIENYTPVSDEQALDLWRALVARNNYIRALLPQFYGSDITKTINTAEGLYEC